MKKNIKLLISLSILTCLIEANPIYAAMQAHREDQLGVREENGVGA